MLHDIPQDMPADSGSNDPASSEQLARQQAIKQIERKRRFWTSTVPGRRHDRPRGHLGHLGVPQRGRLADNGFSQSSGILTCGTTGSSTRSARGCC